MALQSNKNASSAKRKTLSEEQKADAFLNLKIVDAQGNVHRFRKGLALHLENRLDRTLINLVKANPALEFTITGSVIVVQDEPQDDIPLFGGAFAPEQEAAAE